MTLADQFRAAVRDFPANLPPPGFGKTPLRHQYLAEIARTNVAMGRLMEAHMDATAMLQEAGRAPDPGCLYGVWAAESPGRSLRINDNKLYGTKVFCTGATIIDRALVTIVEPEQRLAEVDLCASRDSITYSEADWVTCAFAETHTATAIFDGVPIENENMIGPARWYLDRPGFWHGACGPAACWAGGALGLVDYAVAHVKPEEPHALAHVGAMKAVGWAMQAALVCAGREIDRSGAEDADTARARALMVRHVIDEGCTEILLRLGRAFGPRPLAFDQEISKRCQELSLYIRQCHAERDLETLGHLVAGNR